MLLPMCTRRHMQKAIHEPSLFQFIPFAPALGSMSVSTALGLLQKEHERGLC